MFELGSCIVCETFLWTGDVLCRPCWERFHDRILNRGPVIRRHPVFIQSLWAWNARNEELSRRLIYGMKGLASSGRWMKFAAMLLQMSLAAPKGACLVPIPGKKDKPDHASGLAEALHRLTGLPVENCLLATGKKHQRSRNRRDRRAIRIERRKKRLAAHRTYILVDDVVTTAATLEAAAKALKRPRSTQAWCFMDRELVS